MLRWFPCIAGLLGALTLFGVACAEDTVTSLRLAVAVPEAEETSCIGESDAKGHPSKDYIDHLQSRFRNPIILCLTKDNEASAALLAAGEADLAWVSPEAFVSIKNKARPFMTLRPHDGIGRVEAVIFAKADGPAQSLADLAGGRVGILGQPPVSLNDRLVKSVLSEQGGAIDQISFKSFQTTPLIADAVRSGEVSAGAIEVTAWARYCHLLDPAPTRCNDLDVLARAYPVAEKAMVIADRLPLEYHYRMLSVHSMMHFEAPLAFEWISGGKGKEFEPTEAGAFSTKIGKEY